MLLSTHNSGLDLIWINLIFLNWNWNYRKCSVVQWGVDANKVHCKCLWQVIKWSLVSPAACINEWSTVGPTHLNPLLIMSLLMLSDFDVLTGILWPNLYWVEMGLWLTKPQMYLSNEPKSLLICNGPIYKLKRVLKIYNLIYSPHNSLSPKLCTYISAIILVVSFYASSIKKDTSAKEISN